ncbi:hypothetical protein PGH12_06995 [Chryseobacterium wangxinyae]|uniref:hypothetical protein n=1 Tax=Chryseobacterium sp. CY350 TaxID=2997336 RepID=UPI00226E2752|nr:hypothetical protein [Chryseobacterium sp. CY350]MCY0976898.1 hypothetical protein [Chryseobacterium sp. CY350]WBZ96897.1 hypothetical protein PGH12_06995 [Chryseobacterium sp. CY350]
MDEPTDMVKFYNDGMQLVQARAIEKNISFDKFFRDEWGLEAENVMTFDSEYFDDPDRRDMYVFLSAVQDNDIFVALEYIWLAVHGEVLTENVLRREIFRFKDIGIRF